MSVAYPSSPSRRLIRVLDLAVVLWTAGWILMGVVVRHEVRGLRDLSDTVEAAGNTMDQAGRQLDTLRGLPFVGDRIHTVGQQLSTAANSAIESGRSSRRHIESLSLLLALAIAMAPTVPLIAMYVPLRGARIKEARSVRRELRQRTGDPVFEEFLARRAVERLPYARLRKVTPNPWEDLRAGRHGALADAELRRLGVRRPKPGRGRPRALAS